MKSIIHITYNTLGDITMIKAISFDVGHTLIQYKNPLNWKSLYKPALENISTSINLSLSEDMIIRAIEILSKYNTRINYREYEVTSNIIFEEILNVWKCPTFYLESAKFYFYSYFQVNAVPFPETIPVLAKLKQMNMYIGILTDVAYGMDNKFSLKDLESILTYIDLTLTSVDVGFRKPNQTGFLKLLSFFNIVPNEMLYIGDEEKDIQGANALDIPSILINRTQEFRNYGQKYTINSLDEIFSILPQLP